MTAPATTQASAPAGEPRTADVLPAAAGAHPEDEPDSTDRGAAAPADVWDDSDLADYTSPGHAAGGVAWNVLTHSGWHAAGITALLALQAPVEFEDMFAAVFDLITDAGRVGYLTGKVDAQAFVVSPFGADGAVSIEQVARAVAVLMGVPILEADMAPGAAA